MPSRSGWSPSWRGRTRCAMTSTRSYSASSRWTARRCGSARRTSRPRTAARSTTTSRGPPICSPRAPCSCSRAAAESPVRFPFSGGNAMTVNAGARLDRLPMSGFHRRILWLIGIGMFFDGFDIYIAATVLGATIATRFATLAEGKWFVSMTFVGMTIGSLATGFLGDRFGRRFTYQVNLMVFGLASLAAALAPSMAVLIACRFVMGIGLGAENVVGYSTLTEFVPPAARGRMQGLMTVFVVTGLPISSLLGLVLVPVATWRVMFVIGGLGAIAVWYVRKQLPESPRWLAAAGRGGEAEAPLAPVQARGAD